MNQAGAWTEMRPFDLNVVRGVNLTVSSASVTPIFSVLLVKLAFDLDMLAYVKAGMLAVPRTSASELRSHWPYSATVMSLMVRVE